MDENSYCILQTPEYPRSQVQINKRLLMIKYNGYFGDHKSISFYDERRIYYAYIPEKKILLLLGGNKNGQSKDVSKAKAIYLKATKS